MVRAALTSVWTVEPGHVCPISMTYAVVPALRFNPELAAVYEPLLTSREYDPELRLATTKPGITAGMSMTEKQGGSDVRAGTTQATPNADGTYSLTGHKWFTSAPMCDIFLVLAQAPNGLSCFMLPRILPDGTRNRMFLQRLKDKLGNHANASSEVEYDGATAWLVGEEGRGVPTIIEMVNLTRLDCTLGSATSMRTGLTRAIHHAQHRKAFGAYLIDQPLMRNVLADLAVEAEAATMVAMRMAGATDKAVRGDQTEALFRRIGLAASKYWVCKRSTPHAAEALECLGGNGYVEDSGMPRLYREAPLMGIWEGSGNVSALDTLRAMATRPECIEVLFDELAQSAGQDARLDSHVENLRQQLGDLETIQYRARKVAEDICLALQGSLLVRHGHPAVAEAFLATRLGGQWGGAFGTMPTGLDLAPILERALVKRLSRNDDPRDQAGRFRQPENDDLRGHRPGCPHYLQPAGEGQRDRRRHAAGAVGIGGACGPGSQRPRHPGVRSRRRFLRGLRPVAPTPTAPARPAAPARTRAPCWTARPRPSITSRISRGIR